MRHIIYFSKTGPTSGKALSKNNKQGKINLVKAGRIDIAIHSIIQSLFLSHDFRKDCVVHLVFYGQPNPPRHIEIMLKENSEITKKKFAELLKRVLYKYKEGEKTEPVQGYWIEKKTLFEVVKELKKSGSQIFVLDKNGEDIRKTKIETNPVFLLGDQEGIPKKEKEHLSGIIKKVSLGNRTYLASQTIAVVNNELDYRGI